MKRRARNSATPVSVQTPVQYNKVSRFVRNQAPVFSRRYSRVLLGGFLMLVAASASAASLLPSRAPDICGSFISRTPLDKARTTVKRAIDEGTRELSIFVRGIARKRLHKLNRVARDIEIAVDQGQVAVTFEGEIFKTPANGQGVPVDTLDGAPVLLSQTVSDDRVEQRFLSKRGELRRVFLLNGNELQLHVTMSSKHLSKPIEYSLLYGEKPELEAAR